MNWTWGSQSRSAMVTRALAWSAALGAPLIGLLSLAGWALGVRGLTSLAPGYPRTMPNTALGLVLGGLALGMRLPARPSRARDAGVVACAAGMVAIGAVSLFQDFVGVDLGVDGLLLHAFGQPVLETVRSSPLSSMSLLLLGPALVALGRTNGAGVWTHSLPVLVLLLAMLGFNGLLFGPVATGAMPFLERRSMGLLTAVALLLLSLGTLCARPAWGVMARITQDSLGGFLARRLVPVALLGPPLVGTLLVLLHEMGAILHDAKFPLFATVVSAGGTALVLLSARALDVLEAGRNRATAALEASEARFRGLLETAPDPMVTVDALGQLRFVNAEAARVFGYTREELLGQAVEVLVPEGLFGGQQLGAGSVVRAVQGLRKDGSAVPLEVRLRPVSGQEGSSVIATLRDVTERRELERLREEYVSLISHDLRNPLHTITLRASLLQRGLHERQLAREEGMTEAILRSVDWMSSMIEELLEGSRLEANGQKTLHRERKDLVRFLEEVLERDVPPDMRERFQLEAAASVPAVWVDAARLERVVANLLGNALKYSPPGTPVVVRAQHEGEHVRVSVHNQGTGLAPEDAAHVFDKYYRTREGSSSDGKGLGLGLYISRLIVEAHGGRIWVESLPGEGATFHFSLPVEPPQQQAAPAHEP